MAGKETMPWLTATLAIAFSSLAAWVAAGSVAIDSYHDVLIARGDPWLIFRTPLSVVSCSIAIVLAGSSILLSLPDRRRWQLAILQVIAVGFVIYGIAAVAQSIVQSHYGELFAP